jgi:hypothetical protein
MNDEEIEEIRASLVNINTRTDEIQKILAMIKETLLERPDATCVITVGPLAQREDDNQSRKTAEIIFVYGSLFDIQYT